MRTYEVHWARANRADEVSALRTGAAQHETLAAAEAEAKTLTPPRPDLVPIVDEMRTYPARLMKDL